MTKRIFSRFVISIIIFLFIFQSISNMNFVLAKTTQKTYKKVTKNVKTKSIKIKYIGDSEIIIHPLQLFSLEKRINAKMTDGSIKMVNVVWDKYNLDREPFTEQTVFGTVKGYSKKVKCNIIIGDYLAPKKEYKEAKPGDVVGISEKIKGISYEHYGVYIGNNRVLHYSSPTGNYDDAVVMEDSMEKNFPKGKYFVLNFDGMKVFSPKETIKRAKSKIGEKKYDIVNNNCEHYAVWCKTGVLMSYQIYSLTPDELQLLYDIIKIGINVGTQR